MVSHLENSIAILPLDEFGRLVAIEVLARHPSALILNRLDEIKNLADRNLLLVIADRYPESMLAEKVADQLGEALDWCICFLHFGHLVVSPRFGEGSACCSCFRKRWRSGLESWKHSVELDAIAIKVMNGEANHRFHGHVRILVLFAGSILLNHVDKTAFRDSYMVCGVYDCSIQCVDFLGVHGCISCQQDVKSRDSAGIEMLLN